jgi:hypothetical protein
MEAGLEPEVIVILETNPQSEPVLLQRAAQRVAITQQWPAIQAIAQQAYGKSAPAKGAPAKSAAGPYSKGAMSTVSGKGGMSTVSGKDGIAMPSIPGQAAPQTLGAPGKGGAMSLQNRFSEGSYQPVKLCTFWVQDPAACQKGAQCTFAHGVQELRADAVQQFADVDRFLHSGFRPREACRWFELGACKNGLMCTYAHCEEEIVRPLPKSQG